MTDRPTITDAEIEHRFGYHRATFPAGMNLERDRLADWADVKTADGKVATAPQHARVRQACIALAKELRDIVPATEGRYLALSLTALEETMHWANAGVAMSSPLVDES